jgi:hypothetical protein
MEAHMLVFMSSWLQTLKFQAIGHRGVLFSYLLVNVYLKFCFPLMDIFGSSHRSGLSLSPEI